MYKWKVESPLVPGNHAEIMATSITLALKRGSEMLIKYQQERRKLAGMKPWVVTEFIVKATRITRLKKEYYITVCRPIPSTASAERQSVWIEITSLGTFSSYKEARVIADQQKDSQGNILNTWVKERYKQV